MPHMFYSCTKLEKLDLSLFATPNMTSMLSAFQNCKNLKTIYVTSAFTTDKVTEGRTAFAGCVNLPNYTTDKTGVEMRTREREVISRLLLPVGCDGMRQPARSPSIAAPRSLRATTSLIWATEMIRIGIPMLQKSRRWSSKLVSGMKPTRRAPIGLMVVRILPA